MEEDKMSFLNGSRVVQFWLRIFARATIYLRESRLNPVLRQFRHGLRSLTPRAGGVIIITAIICNIFLSLLLKKGMGLFGLLMQLAFLFMSAGLLFFNGNWQELKKTSWFLRLINKYCNF